jgi:hypothetical protein
VGLVLDAAVVVLAIIVCGSLGLLAWTLAVNGRAVMGLERRRIAAARKGLAVAERTLHERLAPTEAALRDANDRIRPKGDR